jgi:ligand-binding sensor domain-containing protein
MCLYFVRYLTLILTYARRLWIILVLLHSTVSNAQKTLISKPITVNQGLPQGFVSGIVQDDDGFIWLGTRDGLARYDGQEFKVFRFNDDRSTNISSNVITNLYHDHKNRIWILHESKVIDILDPREERFQVFTSDSVFRSIDTRFSPNFINVDSQDNVWLINPGAGLWKISLSKHNVTAISRGDHNLLCDTVRGVIEWPDKTYWIFMQRGVQQLTWDNQVISTLRFPFSASNDMHINRNFAAGLAIADNNSILVREMNTAFLFDVEQFRISEIHVEPDMPDNLPGFTKPQRDPEGNLYFELMGGLYQYDIREKRATRIWSGELDQAQSFLIDHSGSRTTKAGR